VPRLLFEGTRDDLRNVLFHELAHLRSNHPVQLFLQQLTHVVCWFHPAVWRASARASLMREYTCDDAVVNEGVKCANYLRTLLRIAESNKRLSQQGAIAFGRTPTELMLRAKRLVELAQGKQTIGRGIRSLGKPAAVAILLAVTCLMTQVSIPSDPMSSSRTAWSTWPTWSAQCLHCFGVTVRDYELFDRRVRPYEQIFDGGEEDTRILKQDTQTL
jgi:bla regulator protein blaR1